MQTLDIFLRIAVIFIAITQIFHGWWLGTLGKRLNQLESTRRRPPIH